MGGERDEEQAEVKTKKNEKRKKPKNKNAWEKRIALQTSGRLGNVLERWLKRPLIFLLHITPCILHTTYPRKAEGASG